MIEEQLLAEFSRQIHAEVSEKLEEANAYQTSPNECALVEVMLGYLEEAGTFGEHDLCAHEDTTNRGRCKVIAYSLPPESRRLEIFTAHYVGEEETGAVPSSEIERLSGRAAKFFEYALKGDLERFSGNDEAMAAAVRIGEEASSIDEVRVYVLTNGVVRERAVSSIEIGGMSVDFEVFDLERLSRAAQEEITRDQIEIDFTKLLGRPIPCLEMKPRPSEYETYLLIMGGDVIADLYDDYGARLFEFNVRSFLQAKGNVNKGLRDTLRSSPERFLAYNNGITATADEIEVGMLDGETVIKRIRGLQIVNGAQTTASIHRARKMDKLDISQVAVGMKLTLVEPEKLGEFVPLIARYANTQNVIQVSDLSANNSFHIALERLSDRVWCPGEESRWFYERTRGAYQVAVLRYGSTPAKRRAFEEECPKQNHFSKTDLARCLMAWWQFPHTVCRGMQKNFAIFMADLGERFAADWEPDEAFYREAVSLTILFKNAQSIIRKMKLPSYGTQVAAYVVAKLAFHYRMKMRLETIWEEQGISDKLRGLILEWAPKIHEAIIEGAGRTNAGEWCKKDGCWEQIKKLPLATDEFPEVESDIGIERPNTGVSTGLDSSNAIETCCKYSGADWARVVAWAADAQTKVEEFDRRVANTLAGYAMNGWRSKPSIKQAMRGIRVLQQAAEQSIVEL